MAGIYLHIPFCRQACHYCNFHFSTSLQRKNDFIAALLREITERKDYIGVERVETVYFGGGTPSVLEAGELDQIMEAIHATFPVAPDAEITLEANPDDFDFDFDHRGPQAWKRAGINRLSIGVQSFFDEDLRWMNRAHDAGQALRAIRMAQEKGLDNISIDLIYGTPTLPDDRWQQNVEQAIALQIPHLSCYALTVEPRTALDTMIRRHQLTDVSPDDQARQFLLLMDWLMDAGYEHYEISNFARPGHRSRHNSSYWKGATYLGLGPSAHSYNGTVRSWNVANNALYIARAAGGSGPWGEQEILTPIQQLNEYIMISLRTMEGCDLGQVAARFGEATARRLADSASRYVREGKIGMNDNYLVLTREGKLLADGIAADLFFEEGKKA